MPKDYIMKTGNKKMV